MDEEDEEGRNPTDNDHTDDHIDVPTDDPKDDDPIDVGLQCCLNLSVADPIDVDLTDEYERLK